MLARNLTTMPFSDPRNTTVWLLWGPASVSTAMRVRRYLEEKQHQAVSKPADQPWQLVLPTRWMKLHFSFHHS
ncbi:hypothetical protein EYF80_057163 [Liparis tanakae]|uniref:Uncharacterized protein n=1 Tax=Liparis tanakae TaxID=230148 RepID=A0A4Z2EUZ0_9TELE|nr:hypothetical protein EYF80_057163 [Liparis tanakae]